MRKLMQFFFHHFYHSLAWTYDFVAAVVSIGRWQAWTRAALPYLRGTRLLEIGFGPGHLQVELNRQHQIVFGLDESRQMIAQAGARLKNASLPNRLLRGQAQTLPLATESLDSVLSTFPSEYIADPETLSEVWRALKPGGRFVITPVAWIDGINLLDLAAQWLFRVTGQGMELTEDLQARIRRKLTEAGFGVEIHLEEIRHSTVMVVVAEKIPAARPVK